MRFDRIWHNARLATLAPKFVAHGGELGEIDDGFVACRDGRIVFAGRASDAPQVVDSVEMIDCGGRLITPGFIDCHTHLVYAGDRAHEFERRLNGESYESIAQAGGGILSTVRATREASEAELVEQSLRRLDPLIAEGVTTIEIKSGYGLSEAHERKQLMAAKALEQRRDVRVTTTFLGAHALPPEFTGRSDEYVSEVCEVMLPKLAADGLIDAVDAFCERIGFSLEQTRRVFDARGAVVELARRCTRRGISCAIRRSPRASRRGRRRSDGGGGYDRGSATRPVLFRARDAAAADRAASCAPRADRDRNGL
jgi:imidazolonepropionase